MIHPLLFLDFFHKLLAPLHMNNASVDAVAYTWLLIIGLLLLSVLATKTIKTVPSGIQNFMEVVIDGIETMIVDTMGEHGRPFFPLVATLALFILTSNLIGLVPGFFPPTANINTTAACALVVFLTTHIVGVKHHGLHYLKHFMGPIAWLAPLIFFIEIIGHVSRLLSLSLRLFGNMQGHELVLMIFFTLGAKYYMPVAPLPMMLMGVLVSFIQAFVFMLLAMIYIQGSLEEAH
jgi:F-type H+-transporting ATPase subunit a